MKALFVVLGLIILIALGTVFYFNNQNLPKPQASDIRNKDQKITVEDTKSINSIQTIGSDSAKQNLGGNYITGMAADAYQDSTAKKIVLFFYADWCPTCRPVDTELKNRLSEIPDGIEIYRINYNDSETDAQERDLAKKFGVTYQHTFVQVDKNGNEITKWNGGGLDNLLSKIK